MTIKDIIEKYLKDNGFDGLAGDECGCGVDDIFPCSEFCGQCEPAKYVKCEDCLKEDEGEGCPYGRDTATEGGCYRVPDTAARAGKE